MNKIFRAIVAFENAVRKFLTNYPVIYAGLTAAAIVVFWEGIAEIARSYASTTATGPYLLILISAPVLVILGTFLPFFVADKKIISELTHEEKEVKKVETEEEKGLRMLREMSAKVNEMDREIHDIERKVGVTKK